MSLNSATLLAIAAAVARYTDAGLSFTALDISRAVQNGSPGHPPVKAPHTSLKTEVHNLFLNNEMGTDYIRTLITVPGNNQAYLYHMDSVDPNTYDPTRVQPLPPAAVAAVSQTAATQVLGALGNPLTPPAAPAAPAVTVIGKPLTSRRAMKDGRLRLPVKAVEGAGWNPGDKVAFAFNDADGSVEFFTTAPANRKTRPATVDTYTNILVKVGDKNAGAEYDLFVAPGYIKAVLS